MKALHLGKNRHDVLRDPSNRRQKRHAMRPKNLVFRLGSVAIVGLLATAAAAQQGPKRGAAPCFNQSCPLAPAAEAPTKSETRAPDKPYDWKASFAEYHVGKVPRTA